MFTTSFSPFMQSNYQPHLHQNQHILFSSTNSEKSARTSERQHSLPLSVQQDILEIVDKTFHTTPGQVNIRQSQDITKQLNQPKGQTLPGYLCPPLIPLPPQIA